MSAIKKKLILRLRSLISKGFPIKTIAIRVEILDKAVYVPHHANSLGKSMNPTILPPAMNK